jgi:hypothetical protein
MNTRVHQSEVIFKAILSQLVIAKTKKQALETAASELNKSNLRMERITLENGRGETKEFKVSQVEMMDWYDVQHTEFSNRFKVYGRIGLSISPVNASEVDPSDSDISEYQLPSSFTLDFPIITLPVGRGNVFLMVLQQLMELKTAVKETSTLTKLA